jgi:hypothetical protein
LYRPEESIVSVFNKYITKTQKAASAAVSVSSLLLSNLLIALISLIVLIIL